MPRIRLIDPWGLGYDISTMEPATLRAWFGEILPRVNASLGERNVPPAQISIQPMWNERPRRGPDPQTADWFVDARVLGRLHPFPARDAQSGMYELNMIKKQLAEELEKPA